MTNNVISRCETETYYDFCKSNAREQLISYAKGVQTEIPEKLRGAFSLLFDASGCNNARKTEEINKMGRVIVAREVVINCIHALSHAQVTRAEEAAMQMAEELKTNNNETKDNVPCAARQ